MFALQRNPIGRFPPRFAPRQGRSPPGQLGLSQVRDSVAVQAYPQVRVRFWLPLPQVTLHGDHGLQSPSPSM